MKHLDKKTPVTFSFSYIDIFFLLLAGLILSFGIGFLAEVHRVNHNEEYQAYLSATVDEPFAHALPQAGDTVFGENGDPIGKVLSVQTEDRSGGRVFLQIKCRLEGEKPLVGDRILLETIGSVRTMRVDLVEELNTEKEGR